MSDWEISQLDQEYGRIEDRRAENAEILRSHLEIRPELIPHDGSTIAHISEIVDQLTYMNYAHNRRISPGVSVERWRKAYGPSTDAMEARFQADTAQTCYTCGGYGEAISRGDFSDSCEVEICPICKGRGTV